jgi:hypothetical protein
MSNTGEELLVEEARMLAIMIVAALGFVGVMGYIFYLTPGPDDHI